MSSLQGTVSAAERSMRSVFVGNIPYEATEEQLKDIFSEVGPVVSFRLVYDRETGKPKGYGFCEYKDQETALSAMRNLNSYELNGRPLRVDNAASEKSKEELKNLQASMGGPPVESPYGMPVEPERAPEAISKAVASLPPEQMFELMKQMKVCIQNNPNEARNMLLQNPQLAYALLQAQVIMRIVDPQVALGLLHRQNPNPAPLMPRDEPAEPVVTQQFQNANPPVPGPQEALYDSSGQSFRPAPGQVPVPSAVRPAAPRPSLLGDRPTLMVEPQPAPPVQPTPPQVPGFPDRVPSQFSRDAFQQMAMPEAMGDRDMRASQLGDRDMRQQPAAPMAPPMGDRDMRQVPMGDQDLRHMPAGQPAPAQPVQPMDPRFRGGPMPGTPGPFGAAPTRPGFADPRTGSFERSAPQTRPEDPRPPSQNVSMPGPGGMGPRPPVSQGQGPRPPVAAARPQAPASVAAMAGISPQDQEKAALIMQVLQLSDQQIAMLPPEQRQSILILKEQVARSAH